MSNSFVNDTGEKSSKALMSGYAWSVLRFEVDQKQAIEVHSGISFEAADKGLTLLNQLYIKYNMGKRSLTIGRSLSAAGTLFKDLSDYGAPGISIDNAPNSFFANGAFPSNVAQQLSPPFENRLSYYQEIFPFLAFGISYAPQLEMFHPAGFVYYTQSDMTHEVSAALSYQAVDKNIMWGATAGFTTARYNNTRLFAAGDVYAQQFSLYWRKKEVREFEFNFGCMDADAFQKDCRAGMQWIYHDSDRWVRTVGYKYRDFSGKNFQDYSLGYAFFLSNDVIIGIEYIIRQGPGQYFLQSDLHWNFGIAYHF